MANKEQGEDIVEKSGVMLARTQPVLARELGCSVALIRAYGKHPDRPQERPDGLYDIEEWRSFMASVSEKVKANSEDGEEGDAEAQLTASLDKTALQCRKIEEEIRKLKILNDEAEGRLIGLDEAEAVFTEMVTGFKDSVLNMASKISPDLAGLDVPETQRRLKEACRETLTNLSLAGQAKKKAFWGTLFGRVSDLHKS